MNLVLWSRDKGGGGGLSARTHQELWNMTDKTERRELPTDDVDVLDETELGKTSGGVQKVREAAGAARTAGAG